MIMMMNRAIWMLLSSCVICELCATHRLMSSHNEPAPTQLRPWSSSGALPPSHEALYVRGTWWSVLNSVFDGLWLDLSSCNCESGYRSDYIGLQTPFFQLVLIWQEHSMGCCCTSLSHFIYTYLLSLYAFIFKSGSVMNFCLRTDADWKLLTATWQGSCRVWELTTWTGLPHCMSGLTSGR